MTQLIRAMPTDLGALLDSGVPLITADLVTITLSGGQVLRWTSFDRLVTVSGTSWLLGPGLETSRLKWSAGTAVDTMQITLQADASVLVNGIELLPFINAGGLDGAYVTVWRAYAAQFGADGSPVWVGKLQRISGKVSDIDRPTRVEAVISVRSQFENLNQMLPRNVWQAQCNATLYDSTCGLSRASFVSTAAVTTAGDSLNLVFGASSLTQAAGFFTLGAITFTSGGNAGIKRTLRSHAAGGGLVLVQAAPAPIALGDTFQIVPGCDRTKATCQAKFSNLARFRGAPFVPSADSVL
jgi:uncharacterized phage protein (TIGR02218 family)